MDNLRETQRGTYFPQRRVCPDGAVSSLSVAAAEVQSNALPDESTNVASK